MDEWLAASADYYKAFGEWFPMMMWNGSESDAIEEIRRCIVSGEPYEPEEGVVY